VYGVHAEDWFVEDQALACAESCKRLHGDEHLVCMSQCPGFVTAETYTCEHVTHWNACAIAIRPPPAPTYEERVERNQQDSRVAEVIVKGLVHLIRAGFAAATVEDDEDDDDSAERASGSEKRARRTQSGNDPPDRSSKSEAGASQSSQSNKKQEMIERARRMTRDRSMLPDKRRKNKSER
jgi:hypothetical protein